MSKRYPIPAGESRVELLVKNSRFIGRAGYTPSVEEARAFIDQVKAEEGVVAMLYMLLPWDMELRLCTG